MSGTTIIIILASIGFILMGLLMLKNKKLKEILISSNMYKDTDKYIKFNGMFNIYIGILGLILGGIDYILVEKSNYIVIIFIVCMLISTIAQKIVVRKYKI